MFGGDMMFDRFIRLKMEQHGGDFIFSCLAPLLRNADIVIANLEGPITQNASVSVGTMPAEAGNFAFTFPTSTARLLARHNILGVSTGNNHIRNFGPQGAEATARYLREAGIGFAGDLPHPAAFEMRIRGVPLALISYNEFSAGRGSASTTLKEIAAARARGDLPLVFAHWGIEYATTSSAYSRELAHRFIDAGAEIVVGAHPHVVQENEIYLPAGRQGGGKHIYYSLGNFIFDQYWNEAVRTGLLLKVVFGASGVESVTEIPVELLRDGRTCPAP
jgi:poly-gamma-glutamate synthesis protein (capsule biosynthesis protein)